MKKIKMLVPLFCALAMVIFLMGSPASALIPKDHKQFLENEDYNSAFDQFSAVMAEAKEKLGNDEYKALEKETEEAITVSVKEDMGTGISEVDAYAAAYWMLNEQITRELHWDWLRKNAEDAQGFYKLKSDAFNGFLALEKGEEKGEYAIYVSVVMKKEPYNSGEFDGLGKFEGNKMIVSDGDDPNVITITFDGETAKLASSKALRESGLFGANVTIDGEYLREKK